MASHVSCGTPWFCDGMTWSAQLYRTFCASVAVCDEGTATAVSPAGGVFASPAQPLRVTAGAGMSVAVTAGYCSVPSATAGHGTYIFGLLTAGTLTAAGNATGSVRQDYVLASVQDSGSPSSFAQVQYVTGTASPPAVPASSIILAQVSVPSGAASIVAGDITDLRSVVVAPGGILPIASPAFAPAAPQEQFFFSAATGTLVQGTGSAGVTGAAALTGVAGSELQNTSQAGAQGDTPGRPASEPWGVGYGLITGFGGGGFFGGGFFGGFPDTDGSLTEEMAVRFTADGQSDYEVFAKWSLIVPAEAWSGLGTTVTGGSAVLSLLLDGQVADSVSLQASDSPSVLPGSAGSMSWFTSAALGTTPSAGQHTAALTVTSSNTYAEDGFTFVSGVSVGGTAQYAQAVFGAPSGWTSALASENCLLRVSAVPAS